MLSQVPLVQPTPTHALYFLMALAQRIFRSCLRQVAICDRIVYIQTDVQPLYFLILKIRLRDRVLLGTFATLFACMGLMSHVGLSCDECKVEYLNKTIRIFCAGRSMRFAGKASEMVLYD